MNLPLPIRVLVLPLSWIYGIGARLRVQLYAKGFLRQNKLKAPVISVGNLSVGGTGKTPMVLWLAEKFLSEGKRVAILSRGYRGTANSSDEVELLKEKLSDRVVFGVGPNRFATGQKIESEQAVDVFLLDDGFQHLKLARDCDILLIDSTCPLHKDFLLPAGKLREPLSAVSRASMVLYTRVQQAPLVVSAFLKFPHLPTFSVLTTLKRVRPVGTNSLTSPGGNPPQPMFAFCGIGNPGAFFNDLKRWGIAIAGKTAFADHYAYSARDVKRLDALAQLTGAKALITTEKDLKNLGQAEFALPLYCCEITMEVPDEDEVWALITRCISGHPGPTV